MAPAEDQGRGLANGLAAQDLADVAVVAIGRNEGERLTRCLESIAGQVGTIVYVDSGSTDGSVEMATGKGASVVQLDLSQPFTAARARNAGFKRTRELFPAVEFVQFVDGDCEIEHGWLAAARACLGANPGVAAVFGRRRERFPDRTIYNRLCDIEWAVPPGESRSFGGDVMIRAAVLGQVGGYRETLIAGEEPELCVRLRSRGWRIMCLGLPMTIHDAAMVRFGQWWRRTRRCGYAYAEGAALHGAPPERHWVKETQRTWLWGVALPAAIVGAGLVSTDLLLLGLVYPAQIARLYVRQRRSTQWPLLTSASFVLGKFPEAAGMLNYHFDRLRGRNGRLIEYK